MRTATESPVPVNPAIHHHGIGRDLVGSAPVERAEAQAYLAMFGQCDTADRDLGRGDPWNDGRWRLRLDNLLDEHLHVLRIGDESSAQVEIASQSD